VIPGRIFISTAGRTDLLLLNWASRDVVPPKKVYLYFHWFKPNDKKLGKLRELALKQPNLEILGPTPSVVKVFQDAGFKNSYVVPYPILEHEVANQAEPTRFTHLLYAGAARTDKGFSRVVDLVAYLHDHGLQIPVTIQTSPEHYGKYDTKTKADIQRLQLIGYPHLQLSPETLNKNEYAALFEGAICLQLYDSTDFTDRISGVTLDAFSAGCPIVASAGTWIARMAQRFDAGLVVEDMSPPQVLSAVQRIISGYAHYNKHANAAGDALQEENSADTLFRILAENS
jgi:glycosyltransferase involved in cell wall biosynthesis